MSLGPTTKHRALWISERRRRPQKKTLECSDQSKVPFYLDFNLISSAQQLTFNLSSCSKGIESPVFFSDAPKSPEIT